MTTRYVGIGGSDASDGLSWANRKLTLNGAEDTPVAATDTIYVGPGAYRESLTVDVSGTAGNPITYIGDVTGENTDGVGGIVRVTGSDNDQSATRANCISNVAFDYRTFRGFAFDTTTAAMITATGAATNWIIEDCSLMYGASDGILVSNNGATDWTVRRCAILFTEHYGVGVLYTSAVDDCGWLIENCLIATGGAASDCVRLNSAGKAAVKNCIIWGSYDDLIDVGVDPNAGQAVTVNNCLLFLAGGNALESATTAGMTEDYNTFWGNLTDRGNVNVGANSVTYPPLTTPPILKDGIKYPWWIGELSEWSQVGRIAGTGEATDDLFGIARPTTSSKKSWGPVQLREAERDTGTVQTGSASLKLADAGNHQIIIPTDGSQITVEVGTRFETNYAGTKPQLIIRQPGASDSTDTAVVAVDTWETLSITITPNASPGYVIAILRSLNTATSGSFATYFDDLTVS